MRLYASKQPVQFYTPEKFDMNALYRVLSTAVFSEKSAKKANICMNALVSNSLPFKATSQPDRSNKIHQTSENLTPPCIVVVLEALAQVMAIPVPGFVTLSDVVNNLFPNASTTSNLCPSWRLICESWRTNDLPIDEAIQSRIESVLKIWPHIFNARSLYPYTASPLLLTTFPETMPLSVSRILFMLQQDCINASIEKQHERELCKNVAVLERHHPCEQRIAEALITLLDSACSAIKISKIDSTCRTRITRSTISPSLFISIYNFPKSTIRNLSAWATSHLVRSQPNEKPADDQIDKIVADYYKISKTSSTQNCQELSPISLFCFLRGVPLYEVCLYKTYLSRKLGYCFSRSYRSRRESWNFRMDYSTMR